MMAADSLAPLMQGGKRMAKKMLRPWTKEEAGASSAAKADESRKNCHAIHIDSTANAQTAYRQSAFDHCNRHVCVAAHDQPVAAPVFATLPFRDGRGVSVRKEPIRSEAAKDSIQ
jgi:hypothetical protein